MCKKKDKVLGFGSNSILLKAQNTPFNLIKTTDTHENTIYICPAPLLS